MKVFSTLSRRKEESVPLTPGEVKVYACGPTAYSLIRIGNARPAAVFDAVRRYFEHEGHDMHYMFDFVDVDSKITKKVAEGGVDADTMSRWYIEECKKDMAAMNVKPAVIRPQATQEIYGMLEMIQTLIDKNHVYVAGDGTVYSRAGSFKEYGKLSHKNLNEFQSGFHEIEVTGEKNKEDPNDFMFWEPKKKEESSWELPWCDGRSGQHIECSVMSKCYLGEQIDIRAGGEDLILPRHESEVAQSECTNDKNFTTYWMHNGPLNIDNKKTSKSLGNFFTIREISKKYDLQALRFFILSAHYCDPPSFSTDLMEASKSGLERILTCVEKLRDLEAKVSVSPRIAGEQGNMEEVDKLRGKYEETMDGDFNAADAVSAILEPVKSANTTADGSSTRRFVSHIKTMIEELCDVLGVTTKKKEEVLDSGIEEMIRTEQQAREEKNFVLTDEIRGKLLGMGTILEDTRGGIKWEKT